MAAHEQLRAPARSGVTIVAETVQKTGRPHEDGGWTRLRELKALEATIARSLGGERAAATPNAAFFSRLASELASAIDQRNGGGRERARQARAPSPAPRGSRSEAQGTDGLASLLRDLERQLAMPQPITERSIDRAAVAA